MELVEGETLREFLIPQRSLTRRLEALRRPRRDWARRMRRGIVHRDLKPDNVMVSVEGYANRRRLATMKAITAQGELIDTAGYMPPEQIHGNVIDQRSDIFSFG